MCMHVESNQQNILIIPTQRTCAKMSLFSATRSLMSTIFQSTPRKLQFSSLIGNTIIRGQNFTFTPIGIQVRGTKMKTRQAAAKRFIPTGRGGLKRNHCGKVIDCFDLYIFDVVNDVNLMF